VPRSTPRESLQKPKCHSAISNAGHRTELIDGAQYRHPDRQTQSDKAFSRNQNATAAKKVSGVV